MEKRNIGGALYLCALGLVLVLAGSSFVWLMARSYKRASEMRGWEKVEAVVLRAEREERRIGPDVPMDYRVGLLYGYTYGGKNYTSDRITLRPNPWTKKIDKVERALATLTEGETVPAYVKPDDPALATLKTDTKAPGYSIWFPGVFVLGGFGIIIGALRSVFRSPTQKGQGAEQEPGHA